MTPGNPFRGFVPGPASREPGHGGGTGAGTDRPATTAHSRSCGKAVERFYSVSQVCQLFEMSLGEAGPVLQIPCYFDDFRADGGADDLMCLCRDGSLYEAAVLFGEDELVHVPFP